MPYSPSPSERARLIASGYCAACLGFAPLCDRCREQRFVWLAGTAGARGQFWAESVARRTDSAQLWPDNDAARRMATAKVVDLTKDGPLRELLARVCWESAARRWEVLRRQKAR